VVKYDLSVNGKRYEVEVEDLRAEPVTVIVNGKAFQVSVTAQSGSPPPRRAPRVGESIEDVYVPTVTSTYVAGQARRCALQPGSHEDEKPNPIYDRWHNCADTDQ
jgi:hypothetical protein